jgi:hypothetical protein
MPPPNPSGWLDWFECDPSKPALKLGKFEGFLRPNQGLQNSLYAIPIPLLPIQKGQRVQLS